MSKRITLIVAIALLVGAVAIYAFLRLRPHPDPDVIALSGNIEVTDVEVSFKIPGWVEERPIGEGMLIEHDQLVARLDDAEHAQEVALREAEVKAYEAELAALVAGSRPAEISEAQAGVALAEAEVNRLRLEFERQRSLHERELISDQEYQAVLAAYEAAQARVREAEERLNLVEEGPRVEEIEAARARLEQGKQARALAETRLGYTRLASPLSGIVLSENVDVGEYVVSGVPVVTVGDLENVWLRAYVNEPDLGRVKPGQPVCVTTDTYPDKTYEGRLSFIASQAEFTPKNVQTTEERVKLVYRVKIDIPNVALELKPGMPADAAVWLGEGKPPCLQ